MTNIDEAWTRLKDDLTNGVLRGEGAEDVRAVLDALDAARRERDEARADILRMGQDETRALYERDALAAVIERARAWAEDPYNRQTGRISGLDNVLSAVPADVLRNPYRETKERDR
ncbi:hypothetical protein FVO59_11860 [Microbacterium esteraromaticum]|uniref:Uncharacterized protein n=1 Tax=Microbacterium esteraromaticum TaxID=57043 RepID=A0A7D8ADX2_9MICO|nr:hypothetical protein [Microbacterium esteraromaticum]QMU97824.1 hypothetical protein FVO59_11860 [Microbacterium esteraromaticum]